MEIQNNFQVNWIIELYLFIKFIIFEKIRMLNNKLIITPLIDMSFDLKSNQIILGDMFSLCNDFPDNSVDLVITDPPFYIMNKKNLKFKNRTDIIQNANFDSFNSYSDFLDFTQKWMALVYTKMKENSSAYIFFGAQYISDLLRICENLNMQYKGILVWHKTNPVPKIRKSGFLSSTELLLFMVKGKPTFNFLGQNKMHNFIETPIVQRPERLVDYSIQKRGKHPTLHPTQKPLKLLEHLITISSNENDVVFDPFAGTGTINVACKKLLRNCVSFEINPKYFEAAQKRLMESKPKKKNK